LIPSRFIFDIAKDSHFPASKWPIGRLFHQGGKERHGLIDTWNVLQNGQEWFEMASTVG
jgi:hypothetical protein